MRRILAVIGLVLGAATVTTALPAITPTAAPVVAPARADAAVAYPFTFCLYFAGDGTGRWWVRMGETANNTNSGQLTDSNGNQMAWFNPGTATYYNGVRHAASSNMGVNPLRYQSNAPNGSWTAIGPAQFLGNCHLPLN